MKRSLCEQMNSHYAGWGDNRLELKRYRGREKCKWDFVQEAHAAGRIYSGSGCGIVPIRTRGDSMSGR